MDQSTKMDIAQQRNASFPLEHTRVRGSLFWTDPVVSWSGLLGSLHNATRPRYARGGDGNVQLDWVEEKQNKTRFPDHNLLFAIVISKQSRHTCSLGCHE